MTPHFFKEELKSLLMKVKVLVIQFCLTLCNPMDCSPPSFSVHGILQASPGGGHGNPLRYSCLENPHGQRSLVGHSPWGHKESDTTKRLNTAQQETSGGRGLKGVRGAGVGV